MAVLLGAAWWLCGLCGFACGGGWGSGVAVSGGRWVVAWSVVFLPAGALGACVGWGSGAFDGFVECVFVFTAQ